MKHIPNEIEQELIMKILTYYQSEYALVQLTKTMMTKSIIDAHANIRNLLSESGILNFSDIGQGQENKKFLDCTILSDNVIETRMSVYRPNTKKGDPRFWINNLKREFEANQMMFLTVYKSKVIVIPLVKNNIHFPLLKVFFGIQEDFLIKNELIELVKLLHRLGPILSVSPEKYNPKDVGDTLEFKLGQIPNSSKKADFKESIELKAKELGKTTKDTLFSMVPDWKSSPVESSNSMILKYGYDSNRHEGYKDLFVTVSNKPNAQGLYLELDEEKGFLYQMISKDGTKPEITCIWKLSEIKDRLFEKHPSTLWLGAERVVIDGKIHFHYKTAEYTHKPIFASFLLLISQGIITYDWRGRVKADGTCYKDKGHCFRISPKYRERLFAKIETIEL